MTKKTLGGSNQQSRRKNGKVEGAAMEAARQEAARQAAAREAARSVPKQVRFRGGKKSRRRRTRSK